MRHVVGSFVELQVASPRCHVCGNGSPVYHAIDAVVALQIFDHADQRTLVNA